MADNSSSNRRIAKNSIFLSIRMVIVLCISLYTTRAVLNILGVEDYGVYNVVCGFVSMFAFLNTSMSNGIQRFYNFELGRNGEEGANKVYCNAIIVQLLLGIIIIVLTETFGIWYLNNKMVIPIERMYAAKWIFQFSIISFLFIILQAPYTAAVMAHENMDFYAVVSVLDAILKLVIVFIIPFASIDKLVLYGLLLLLISIIDFGLYFIYCKKKYKEIHLPRENVVNKKLFVSMLSFSGWNLFGSFSNMMRDQGINLILNFFFGPIVNAARGVAIQINSGVTNLVTSILTPVRPQVIQSYAKGEYDRSLNLTYSISKFSLCFLWILSLPICVEIDFILKIWLGDNIPQHTQAFSIIILMTSAVLIPMGALATLVHASGDMKKYQVYGSLVKILSVPVAFVLMKLGYSPEWALLMVLIFDLIGLFVGMVILKGIMRFSIKTYLKEVVLPLLPVLSISLILSLVLHRTIDNEILRFFLVLIICTLITLFLFYLVGMSKAEKNLLRGMVTNFIEKRKRQ